jgi:hypothetical protein
MNSINRKRKMRAPSSLNFEMIASTKCGMSFMNIKDEMINKECVMGAKPLKLHVIPSSISLFKSRIPPNPKQTISKIQTSTSNNEKVANPAASSLNEMKCRDMDDDK